MELEVIRMCAAGAADPTIGINAMLAGIPLDGDDERPGTLQIYNSVDHGPIARRAVPAHDSGLVFPALAIYVADAATLEQVRTVVRDGEFPIAFSHIELESDSAKGNRDACYTTRALLRFLTRFVRNEGAAFRKRGGVQLIEAVGPVRQSPIYQKWDHGLVQSTTVVTWRVRETAA